MAKVLENFLIGIGLDTEKYDGGAKKVENSLERMRSLVGITGSVLVGAFGAAGAAVVASAKRVDDFYRAAQGLKTPIGYVYDFGRALVAMDGDASDALSTIKAIETAQANLKIKGLLGPLEDVALSHGDINALSQTKNGKDFLRTLAPMVQNMTKDQQRLTQNALGFSDPVMNLLRQGLDKFDASIARAHELAGNLDDATQAARDFNKALGETGTRMERISNQLTTDIAPGFTDLLNQFGSFLDHHKQQIDAAGKKLGEHPTATALMTGGGAASAAGVALRGIGMRGLGAGLTRLGTPGMIAGGAMMAWDTTPKDIEDVTGYRPSPYIFDKTPLDATRDAYNYAAYKFGLKRSEKGSGAIDYLEGSYGRLSDQISGFDSYLQDYTAHKSKGEQPGPTVLPNTSYLPLNRLNENPIYAGGEVSNTEAADANPSVVMVKDQRQQSERPIAPPKVDVKNHIDLGLTIDGHALEHKINSTIQRREDQISDDIYSSVDR